jgi:hypothetical protein
MTNLMLEPCFAPAGRGQNTLELHPLTPVRGVMGRHSEPSLVYGRDFISEPWLSISRDFISEPCLSISRKFYFGNTGYLLIEILFREHWLSINRNFISGTLAIY